MVSVISAKRTTLALYMRNFVFGVEDSLVSTVGLLSGIAIAGVPRGTIFITGVVLIFVEAFSMAAGSFISEFSAEEYVGGEVSRGKPVRAGIVMFFSYFVSGFIPLFPYLFFQTNQAFPVSIACSLAALFILGVASGRFVKKTLFGHGIRMLIVGGLAIGVGVRAGQGARVLSL